MMQMKSNPKPNNPKPQNPKTQTSRKTLRIMNENTKDSRFHNDLEVYMAFAIEFNFLNKNFYIHKIKSNLNSKSKI